jgi:hypothetical protein
MLPTFIRSALEFETTVRLGSTPESLVLEFKATINGWNAPAREARTKAQKETCRDIAQFANTLGGCLLVGVHERPDPTSGFNIADSIAPVKEVDKLRQWIEQAIMKYLVPSTFSHDIVPLALPQGSILAVNVPASRYLISLWDRDNHTIEYMHRTSHGKEWMNPDEMERHLMDGSRAAKLALIEAKAHMTSERVEVVGGVWREYSSSPGRPVLWNPRESITIGQMEEYWFELLVPNERGMPQAITILYSLIKEAWAGASGVLLLLLTIRIIMRDDKVTLEPYV